MTKSVETYGLLLRTENKYGTDYLVAELVRREGDHHAPRNCSEGGFVFDRPKHMQGFYLDGLQMSAFVSKMYNGFKLLGFEPKYYNAYSVTYHDARRMVKTLSKIYNHAEKSSAHEPEDYFMSLCAALKLSFVVEMRKPANGSSYDDNRWEWMTIGEGRNRYRQLISDMVDTATEREREIESIGESVRS